MIVIIKCPAHPKLSRYFSESQSIDHYLVLNAGSESEYIICGLEQTNLVNLHFLSISSGVLTRIFVG